jgi:hypothetical protein
MTAPATAPTTSVKSSVITNLDASPLVRASAGQGAPGRLIRTVGLAVAPINMATSNMLRLVRIPSNCIVLCVRLMLDTAPSTSLTGAVGLWYSDSTTDGTSVINQGNLTAISSAFFLPATVITTWNTPSGVATVTSTGAPIDITFANAGGAYTDGQYIPSNATKPIWQAVATSLALQTTPVGAFTNSAIDTHFQTASAGASVYVRSDDPGGYFDICYQETTTGNNTGAINMTAIVDYIGY